MEPDIVPLIAGACIFASFVMVAVFTLIFVRRLGATVGDAQRFKQAVHETPLPTHEQLLEVIALIHAGDPRLDARAADVWARELLGAKANYVRFLLEMSGQRALPAELPPGSHLNWSVSQLTRGRAIALVLARHLDDDAFADMAREGLTHEDSVDVAHDYLSLWEGHAIANVERDDARTERARHEASDTFVEDRLEGSLQLTQGEAGGELTITHEEGALSQVDG